MLFFILTCSFRAYRQRPRAKLGKRKAHIFRLFETLVREWFNEVVCNWIKINDAKYQAMTVHIRLWKAWIKRKWPNEALRTTAAVNSNLFILQYYRVRQASSPVKGLKSVHNFLNRRNSLVSSDHEPLLQRLKDTTQRIMRHGTRTTIYIFNRKNQQRWNSLENHHFGNDASNSFRHISYFTGLGQRCLKSWLLFFCNLMPRPENLFSQTLSTYSNIWVRILKRLNLNSTWSSKTVNRFIDKLILDFFI